MKGRKEGSENKSNERRRKEEEKEEEEQKQEEQKEEEEEEEKEEEHTLHDNADTFHPSMLLESSQWRLPESEFGSDGLHRTVVLVSLILCIF